LKRSADMQCPVMQKMILVQQEIAEKGFKVFCRFMNPVFQVIVIYPDQRITKISSILSKNIVYHIKTQRAQIFDKEYRPCSGVSLTENMDLPQSRNKKREMMDDLIHREILIEELLLFGEIIIQCCSRLRGTTVEHSRTRQMHHPINDMDAIVILFCLVVAVGI